MATEQDDRDIPESGGVFTFGKSKFAENLPNKFWIGMMKLHRWPVGTNILYSMLSRAEYLYSEIAHMVSLV
ncbi:hypothetical protein EB796_015507 [Bugula neritina]|uniref:Uncharacterized protein n=1 Tax=Bugula neritina TaxID=10212 RepID=A0A7J7JKP8_BUGNE|nr:hypothetical protein EB796_015507 [Bugula neritina]